MKIITLWMSTNHPSDMPWLLNAYDEYTADEHGGVPPNYTMDKNNYPEARELVIEVPESAVKALFWTPMVKATVKEPK